jgi:hypothetical protein
MKASLAALLTHLIDYAGLYPPASLPLARVTENYRSYLSSPDGWILNRLVLPLAKLADSDIADDWRVTLLVEQEPGSLPPQIETLETKLPHRLSLPTYSEVLAGSWPQGSYAKIRTGGLTPEAIPSSEHIAEFLWQAAARRLPFKATAGLHHPIRAMRPLTYASDSPRATMHGFLNVFLAASFAWHGVERGRLIEVVNESDPRAFEFNDGGVNWRGQHLTTEHIRVARRDFAHSLGSCSFEEPLADLRDLGMLP